MPCYEYSCDCGKTDSQILPCSKSKFLPKCECGKKMYRDIVREQCDLKRRPGCWPMASDGLAVAPQQIDEARKEAEKNGVSVDFTKQGQPILTSQKHRREYMRAIGFHDKDACYGDKPPNR